MANQTRGADARQDHYEGLIERQGSGSVEGNRLVPYPCDRPRNPARIRGSTRFPRTKREPSSAGCCQVTLRDEADPLRDEGEAYAAKLREAEVDVTTMRVLGCCTTS
ncbi:hypothetical protein DN069_03490 [Streptacidiphilus pinicola]|uniref:Uncharacterized protein n=1 Tax=Streptacidiphilus pinicola TaxID=2219663 RepID=A0A2X0KJZ0_9ACTN|nr:hypothetical protein DN069_03490 [Streptacidiphilus pinicola]